MEHRVRVHCGSVAEVEHQLMLQQMRRRGGGRSVVADVVFPHRHRLGRRKMRTKIFSVAQGEIMSATYPPPGLWCINAQDRQLGVLGAAGAQLGPGVVALVGCGREPGCPGPPAQIRTCALTHTAPTLGGGRQTACRAKGAEPARGANRAPRGASHQSALSVSSVTAAARF